MNTNVLLVDDDPNILQGFKRHLRKHFRVDTALGAKEALEVVAQHGPFAVIVSDMQMPEMNGIQLLHRVREMAPDTVRMMLTGNADQKTAMDAVNDGRIFRFLTKPCSPEHLRLALEAGVEQYRLVTAERELLCKTLSGSVSILTEVLSLVNPAAFGQATSVRRIVREMCKGLQLDNAWEIEVAAMLSHIGCITLPKETLAKLSNGEEISQEERAAYQRHPQVGFELISKIPRLGGVAEIIAYQHKHFDGSGLPSDEKKEEQIPLGARILKLVIDVVQLMASQESIDDLWITIDQRTGWYDPALVRVLAKTLDVDYISMEVGISGLEEGMVLAEHVLTESGELLLAKGQEVTPSLRERLLAFATTGRGVREPIRVRRPVHRDNGVTMPTDSSAVADGGWAANAVEPSTQLGIGHVFP